MNKEPLQKLLEDVRSGRLSVNEAMHRLRSFPYDDIGYAKIDTHRSLRKGFPEVIFCQGKTEAQIQGIVRKMRVHGNFILAMRAWEKAYRAVKKVADRVEFNRDAKAILIGKRPEITSKGLILVVSAGTADIPVAEEAAITAEVMGNRVERLNDVGVAGLHRLLDRKDALFSANVLVVVAGMEGALPSVVGGLVDKPLIAVPTSVGYGASFGGLSALLTMLTSCVPGIGVVNIDNGFGAGYLAALINRLSD
jgi:NCAIR mutase (PurE)-related protein